MTDRPGAFSLPPEMREEIIDHARAELPRECCGVIISHSGRPVELRRLTNVYPGIDFYEPDASELYRLVVEIDDSDSEIGAIYHSHPVSEAHPSPRDVEYAGWPDSVYLICSLEITEQPMIRAFRIVDGAVTELA